MLDNKSYDVVIVGGGLVGCTLALLLLQSSDRSRPRIALVEAGEISQSTSGTLLDESSDDLVGDFDPRVVALTLASENLFKNLSIWSEVEALRTSPYRDMSVWDSEGTGAIQFHAEEAAVTHLGTIVENRLLLAVLRNRLLDYQEKGHLDLYCGSKVERLGPVAGDESQQSNSDAVRFIGLANGQVLSARTLVAADGANSAIRSMAAFKMREWSYNHNAIVTTVKTQNTHEYTARQVFQGSGPLAFLPLQAKSGDCRYSSIVWSQLPERANELMEMSDSEFASALEQAFESKLGRIDQVAQRFSIPLRQRHALNYYKDRIVLVGDAAHTIHPLAGQGVNLGLLDVAVLAEELLLAFDKQQDLGSIKVLSRYQRRRVADNLAMMSVMEGFKRLFEDVNPLSRMLRNVGMSVLNQHPLIKQPILSRALGLHGDLPLITQSSPA